MNVNQKGVIGLIEVIRDLAKNGYECFTPIHDYSPVDLIVLNKDYNPIRIQVKYKTADDKGVVEIQHYTMVNGKRVRINHSAIDGWAIYCPDVDSVIYISKHEIDLNLRALSFRIREGKNSVNKNKEKRKMYSEFGDVAEWPKATPC